MSLYCAGGFISNKLAYIVPCLKKSCLNEHKYRMAKLVEYAS